MKVKFLHPNAKLPSRGSPLSAGLDLYCCESVDIAPHCQVLINTGIAIQVDYENVYIRIAPRSGLASKNGLMVNAGVIDQDYTGEVKVLIYNTSGRSHKFNVGDKIAQMIIERIYMSEPYEVEQLDATQRGAGGFGSTGG